MLPSGYKALEYIEGTGTQYIDTGLSMPYGFRAVFDVMITQSKNSLQFLIGSHEQNAPYYRNYFAVNENAASWNLGCYDYYHFGTLGVNTRYQIDVCNVYQKLSCIINGQNYPINQSVSTNAARSSRSLYMLAINYEDGLFQACARLYSCQLYDNETLVRDFTPCKNSTGEVGLYDSVTETFYGNNGTGSFIAGPMLAPNPPTNLDATFDEGIIHLLWTDSTTEDVTGYRIYQNGVLVTTTPAVFSLFEFPFSNDSLTENLLELSSLERVQFYQSIKSYTNYTFSVVAFNKYGESDPVSINVYYETTPDITSVSLIPNPVFTGESLTISAFVDTLYDVTIT